MDPDTAQLAGAALVAVLVGSVVALVVGALLGGAFLRWSVRILEGFSPSYGRAVLTVIATIVVGIALSVVLVAVLVATGLYDADLLTTPPAAEDMAALMGAQAALSLGNFLIGLVVTAGFVKLLIRRPDGTAIGFGRSLLIALLYTLMMLALVFVVAIVLAVLIGVGAGIAASG